jgi:hypothetical protein
LAATRTGTGLSGRMALLRSFWLAGVACAALGLVLMLSA